MFAYFLSFYLSKSYVSSVAVAWSGKGQFCICVCQDLCVVLYVAYPGAISCHPTTMQQILKFTTAQSYFRFTQVYIVLLRGCGKRRALGQERCCFPVPISLIGWQFHWHIFIDLQCRLNKVCLYACMYSATARVRFWAPSVGCVCCLPGQRMPQKLRCKIAESLLFSNKGTDKKTPTFNSQGKKKKKKKKKEEKKMKNNSAFTYQASVTVRALVRLQAPSYEDWLPNCALRHFSELDPIPYLSPQSDSSLFLGPGETPKLCFAPQV